MAGTLVIDTLTDGSGNTTSATNAIRGSAKAWVSFNGTTSPGTIRAAYNVSSVTKNATGDFNINFTNALADANYAVVISAGNASVGAYASNAAYSAAPTTTVARIAVTTVGGTPVGADAAYSHVGIFR